MKQIKFTALAAIVLLSAACQKDDSPNTCNNPQAEPQPINIRVVRSNGTDLLNSSNAGAYNQQNITLSFNDNNNLINSPVTVQRIGSTDSFYIKTSLAYLSSGGRTFYLKLSPTDTDTLYVKNDFSKDSNGCDMYVFGEFRHNGNPLPRSSSQLNGGYFRIVK